MSFFNSKLPNALLCQSKIPSPYSSKYGLTWYAPFLLLELHFLWLFVPILSVPGTQDSLLYLNHYTAGPLSENALPWHHFASRSISLSSSRSLFKCYWNHQAILSKGATTQPHGLFFLALISLWHAVDLRIMLTSFFPTGMEAPRPGKWIEKLLPGSRIRVHRRTIHHQPQGLHRASPAFILKCHGERMLSVSHYLILSSLEFVLQLSCTCFTSLLVWGKHTGLVYWVIAF